MITRLVLSLLILFASCLILLLIISLIINVPYHNTNVCLHVKHINVLIYKRLSSIIINIIIDINININIIIIIVIIIIIIIIVVVVVVVVVVIITKININNNNIIIKSHALLKLRADKIHEGC